MTPPAPRYAIYWTPAPAHPLWQAGCDWLASDRPAIAAPRRYGFHATLKAPMALRPGTHEGDFLDAVRRLAGDIHPFAMPPLVVTTLGDFVALRPATSISARHPLRRLADDCVRKLDEWRAPLDDDAVRERLRRQPHSADQAALLQRWGYAHVFEQWRFHMTLSDPLPHDVDDNMLRHRLVADAQRFFASALDVPLDGDSLCVFVEPAPGASFVLSQRFALAG